MIIMIISFTRRLLTNQNNFANHWYFGGINLPFVSLFGNYIRKQKYHQSVHHTSIWHPKNQVRLPIKTEINTSINSDFHMKTSDQCLTVTVYGSVVDVYQNEDHIIFTLGPVVCRYTTRFDEILTSLNRCSPPSVSWPSEWVSSSLSWQFSKVFHVWK